MADPCSLSEELSCCICLEPFKEPVTTPCGHNFCKACLDETWSVQGAPYPCPQCRAVFPARPQLHKNTVLCAVVEQFLQAEPAPAPSEGWTPPARAARAAPSARVACDHCLQEAAVKTCLVCMASFCQEHLRPHLSSPAFRDHQLQQPVADLLRRKCPQHNRLREFFCPDHSECICHVCLVEHKTCSPTPLSQASAILENKLRQKLTVMYGQMNGASKALENVKARKQSVHDTAGKKMEQLRQEYSEIKVLIDASETSFLRKIKDEEKRVINKFDMIYQVLLKKKSEIQSLKEDIELSLAKGDEFEFLQDASKLQAISTKPVYVPKVELDQEMIKGIHLSTIELKNELKQSLRQLQEKKFEGSQEPNSGDISNAALSLAELWLAAALASASFNKRPTFGAPGQSVDMKTAAADAAKATNLQSGSAALKAKVLESFLAKSRPELLEYSVKVVLDFNTAHNKVILSENYTTASAADVPQSYRPHPQRFTYCSQVLGLHSYRKGTQYWEVELKKSNFCGVGVCCGSMERQGPESRLGRNSSSWCVEWFNNKVSAWHNNVEKTLPPHKATRVGVLLSCDHGFVIFFAVTDKVCVMYKFKADFTEALYPAFWVFSVGATISICPPK
ncbi:E3 ubiquitin/ISG15 ligase TRIM25 [Ctenodactylus gundi]